MDRIIFAPSQVVQDTDLGNMQRNAMIGLGYIAQMMLGAETAVVGLACTPTTPTASLTVNVGVGMLAVLTTIDSTPFGSIALDGNPLMKMGVNYDGAKPFTFTAPATTGQSINYLIEATLSESDGTPVVAPYYNPTTPTFPFSGPSNDGLTQNTLRAQSVGLQVKAGTAAATGSQTTPSADSGWVPLVVVTVANGQTQITSSSIAVHPAAPYLETPLPNVRGNHTAVYTNVSGTQQVSIDGGSFTTTGAGTFIFPSTGTCKVTCTAAGGGATGNGNSQVGGGGGAGGTAIGVYSAAPGTSVTVHVGPGGAGAATASGSTIGISGGSSSFGSFCSATGGSGGINNTGALVGGGLGGVGTGGTIDNNAGGNGADGYGVNTGVPTGRGGGSFWGDGGSCGVTGGNKNGLNYGSGGGSGYGGTASDGGAGAGGVIVVEY